MAELVKQSAVSTRMVVAKYHFKKTGALSDFGVVRLLDNSVPLRQRLPVVMDDGMPKPQGLRPQQRQYQHQYPSGCRQACAIPLAAWGPRVC